MWVGQESVGRARSDLADIAESLRRHGIGLALWVALCVAAAAVIVSDAPPQVGAATQLVLEPVAQAVDPLAIVREVHQLTLDDAQAQTQLHLIRSERVLRYVFDTLGLATAPELSRDAEGRIGRLGRWLDSLGGEAQADATPEEAFTRFRDKLHARRIGLTYVIEIGYWAESAPQAVRVVNAVAAAYLRDRLDAAVAGATGGPVLVKRHIDRLLGQDMAVTDAVRAGTIPKADVPDAAVRILGASTEPVGSMFPHAGPALALAACIGLISGLLAVVALGGVERRILSRRRLRDLVGLDSVGRPARLPTPASGRPGDAEWDSVVGAVRVALARMRRAEPPPRIGLLASGDTPFAARAAAAFSTAFVEAGQRTPAPTFVPLASAETPAGRGEALARLEAAHLDAAILVIETDRATIGEVREALGTLRAAHLTLAATVLAH